jgi:hypothetical protein
MQLLLTSGSNIVTSVQEEANHLPGFSPFVIEMDLDYWNTNVWKGVLLLAERQTLVFELLKSIDFQNPELIVVCIASVVDIAPIRCTEYSHQSTDV